MQRAGSHCQSGRSESRRAGRAREERFLAVLGTTWPPVECSLSSSRPFASPCLRVLVVLLTITFAQVATAAEPVPSFRNDVMPVLSKAGCNAGACHGNKSGKGGFKLSLRGQDPGDDYDALTRDLFARRVD